MRRRSFLGSVIAAGIAKGTIPTIEGLTSSSSGSGETLSAPTWLGTEPVVFAVNYVPRIFQRRIGWNAIWLEDDYEKAKSEDAVRQLEDLGVNLVTIALYTGFGLKAESRAIGISREFSERLRRHGIRVGVYVGSTIMYETFLLEKPEAQEWVVPDYLGRPVYYPGSGWHQPQQTFRKRVYFMHPGYREYIKQVIRVGIEDLHAELIHYDNTSLMAAPSIFQHPLAVQDFRTFLQNRYTPETLEERLGFSDVRYVEPPKDDEPRKTVDDPLWQEWADFRCEQLASYFAEIKDYIRSLSPNVALAVNAQSGISGYNTILGQGVDYPMLAPHIDILFNEEGDYAGTTADGILLSKIRSFKMTVVLNKRVLSRVTYAHPSKGGESTWETPGGRVQMAESMVYNRQNLGNVGEGWFIPTLAGEERAYIRFYVERFELYRGVETIADAALLYTHATMGFNNDRPAVSFMLFSQTLIQAKVPFDIIFDQHLKDLSKYRVLILADQECLSDEQLDLIRKYVHEGGGLVATEHSSLYTPWRGRRREFGLKDLWRVDAPPWRGVTRPEDVLEINPVHRTVGRGRVVYVAEVKPAIEKPPTVPMTNQYWKLPENWKILVDAVRWAVGGRLTLEVEAPLTVTAELLKQGDSGRLLLHLINYDLERTPEVKNIQVRIQRPGKTKEVLVLSPDGGEEKPTPSTKDGELAFTVSSLKGYSVAVIS